MGLNSVLQTRGYAAEAGVGSQGLADAVKHAIEELRQQLHEPLMPVRTDGEVLENEWRVYDHVPCQKGFEIIMAEHKTAYHAAWIPPDAPPGKHHHWTPLPRSTTTRAPLSKKRKAAVDEFVLSQRLAAAAHGCDLRSLAELLCGRFKSEVERLRALTRWLLANIAFDGRVYQEHCERGRPLPAQDARSVLKRRTALNDGYANLLHAMCRAGGLQAFLVKGNGKGWGAPKYLPTPLGDAVDARSNHAWNAVFVAGGWQLVDLAWMAGHFVLAVGPMAVHYRRKLYEQFWLIPPLRSANCHAGYRVRSHCRFRNRGTKYVSESGMKWMRGATKRQCDRTLAGHATRS